MSRMSPVRSPAPDAAWLALGAASRLVGVDPDTLRRWADDGRVEVFHTPGGHRRFRRRSLERLVRTGGHGRATLAGLGVTPDRLAAAYRRRYVRHRAGVPDPRAFVSPDEREVFRVEGRQLVEALLLHLDAVDAPAGAAALDEATGLVSALGRRLAASATSLTDAVALFVAARQPFLAEVGALARRRAMDPEQLGRLYEEASSLLDRLLLDFIDGHRGTPEEPQ
jgi:excisionase family DNA binding protein